MKVNKIIKERDKAIKERDKAINFCIILIIFSILSLTIYTISITLLLERIVNLEEELKNHGIKIENNSLKIDKLVTDIDNISDKMEEYLKLTQPIKDGLDKFLNKFGIEIMEITAYSPFDGIEGMCYEGNPNVTASGEPPVAGETVASTLPFGTKIWIEGFGFRRVNDRGGAIGENKVDVVVENRYEAFAWGRRQRVVIYEKPNV